MAKPPKTETAPPAPPVPTTGGSYVVENGELRRQVEPDAPIIEPRRDAANKE